MTSNGLQTASSPWRKSPLHSSGDASRLTALLLGQICPIFSLVPPCQAGASPLSVQRGVSPRAASHVVVFIGAVVTTLGILGSHNAEHSLGWRRGGERPPVARRTALVTSEWIGLNRCSAAGLWALYRRETARMPATGSSWRLHAGGEDGHEGRPATVRSVGDAGRPAREPRELRTVPGGRRWDRHDESRRAGDTHFRRGSRRRCARRRPGTLPQRATVAPRSARDSRLWRTGVLGRLQRGRVQQAPALGELLPAGAIGEEAVVANAVEAGREHVEEHAADELFAVSVMVFWRDAPARR